MKLHAVHLPQARRRRCRRLGIRSCVLDYKRKSDRLDGIADKILITKKNFSGSLFCFSIRNSKIFSQMLNCFKEGCVTKNCWILSHVFRSPRFDNNVPECTSIFNLVEVSSLSREELIWLTSRPKLGCDLICDITWHVSLDTFAAQVIITITSHWHTR
jgi:hypothetical protein